MNTTSLAFSRAHVTLRALSAWCVSAGGLRPRNNPGARMGARAFQYLTAAFAALGLMILVPISPSHAQAPPLGTLANFAILANTGITNTGPTVITGTPANPGDIGSSLASITGFPPGIVTPPGVIHAIGDAPTITAQNALTTAYNNLAGRTTTVDLTSQ